MAASFQTAPSNSQAAFAPTVDMSASPVISRAAPPKPRRRRRLRCQSIPLPSPPMPRRRKPPRHARGKCGAAGELSGPGSFCPPPAAPAPTRAAAAPAPAFTASTVQVEQTDPNALQKLNRSGKGGKLPAGDQSPLSWGTSSANNGAKALTASVRHPRREAARANPPKRVSMTRGVFHKISCGESRAAPCAMSADRYRAGPHVRRFGLVSGMACLSRTRRADDRYRAACLPRHLRRHSA